MSVLNRASSFFPSLTDIEEAKASAAYALEAALRGETARMVCIKRKVGLPYQVDYETRDIKEIANQVVYLPRTYINKEGDNILDAFIDYCAPLIKGNAMPLDDNWLL